MDDAEPVQASRWRLDEISIGAAAASVRIRCSRAEPDLRQSSATVSGNKRKTGGVANPGSAVSPLLAATCLFLCR